MQLTEILNYIFGSTTLVSIYIAYKSRKSEIKKAEASALETIQGVYDKFCADTEKKFDKMDAENEKMKMEIKLVKQENFQFQTKVNQLQSEVELYKTKCVHCSNNKAK